MRKGSVLDSNAATVVLPGMMSGTNVLLSLAVQRLVSSSITMLLVNSSSVT